MLAEALRLTTSQANIDELTAQLEAELKQCEVTTVSYRNKLKQFMIENEIWQINELNYYWREKYREYLKNRVSKNSCE